MAAWRFQILLPDRLLHRDWGALFFAGAFAVVVGTLLFRFLKLSHRSSHYFRWSLDNVVWDNEAHFLGGERLSVVVGTNSGEAFDLGARSQFLLCVALASVLGLSTIDAHGLALLATFQRSAAAGGSSYCPAPEEQAAVKKDDPNAPGCALLRRAVALGYAKDLGDCEIAQVRAATAAVCTLRQLDEPWAHYGWRLMVGFGGSLSKYFGADYFRSLRDEFVDRVARLDSIRGVQRQVLSSAPHSSHHIFTNLPDPHPGGYFEPHCADRFRSLPHRPEPGQSPSQVFEQVFAQLLFEGRYDPPAGYCPEYTVHWGAPVDACKQLVADPEGFLRASGSLEKSRAVLDRWRLGNELAMPGKSSQRPLEPSQFLSFQCYVEVPGAAGQRSSNKLTLLGQTLFADEVVLAPSPPDAALYIDRYDAIASVLVRGFHYGALLSEAGLDATDAEGLEPSFSGKDFLISRLYGLENVDIFLSRGWISNRKDLLEVYPWQMHLRNYVKVFRRQYARERGRL